MTQINNNTVVYEYDKVKIKTVSSTLQKLRVGMDKEDGGNSCCIIHAGCFYKNVFILLRVLCNPFLIIFRERTIIFVLFRQVMFIVRYWMR